MIKEGGRWGWLKMVAYRCKLSNRVIYGTFISITDWIPVNNEFK